MKKIHFILLPIILLCSIIVTNPAQTVSKKKKSSKEKAVKVVENPSAQKAKEDVPPKKNERPPDSDNSSQTEGKVNRRTNETATNKVTNTSEEQNSRTYSYQFTQPNFLISNIIITHNINGKGTITFQQRDSDEKITDPLQISNVAWERIQKLWTDLNFLDSTENYQAEKQFPHLGTMRLTLKDGAKNRTTEFNWTNNKMAESLVNEYKKLSYQFIWVFDINLARENQPLETPKLVDQIDNLIQRNDISDPVQLMPFLQELRDDERLPLIARNNLGKILQRIEKNKDKK